MNESTSEESQSAAWKPLNRRQRRVAGVLVEKSKTTPDVYPMSLNGIKTGANQKSNRSPKMELQEHEVEDILYQLRGMGAAIEIHSGGRVPKFKHELYIWMGVDKAELAVMAELLLRGEQTLGDLRARAARMEKSITGLEQLKPVLDSLKAKNLLLELTPSGRGQIVSHNLYEPDELERLKKDYGSGNFPTNRPIPVSSPIVSNAPALEPAAQPVNQASSQVVTSNETVVAPVDGEKLESLQQQVDDLQLTVERLSEELAEVKKLLE